ncbi:MAG: hypothetical protein HUJ68_08480 [Clostridia bacterium]|nr:hypothetical protein [Clostridia bacterium]
MTKKNNNKSKQNGKDEENKADDVKKSNPKKNKEPLITLLEAVENNKRPFTFKMTALDYAGLLEQYETEEKEQEYKKVKPTVTQSEIDDIISKTK